MKLPPAAPPASSCRYCRRELASPGCESCDRFRAGARAAFDLLRAANASAERALERLAELGAPADLLREEQCAFLGVSEDELARAQAMAEGMTR